MHTIHGSLVLRMPIHASFSVSAVASSNQAICSTDNIALLTRVQLDAYVRAKAHSAAEQPAEHYPAMKFEQKDTDANQKHSTYPKLKHSHIVCAPSRPCVPNHKETSR